MRLRTGANRCDLRESIDRHTHLSPGTEDMPIGRQCVSQNSPSSGLYVYYIRPSNSGGITGLEGGWAVGVWCQVRWSIAASLDQPSADVTHAS